MFNKKIKNQLHTLFSATPFDAFFGMNSVSIVVAMLKIIMLPTPKKKFATIGAAILR